MKEKLLQALAQLSYTAFKFVVWSLLTGATFWFCYTILKLGLSPNPLVHPKQDVMAKITSVATVIFTLFVYIRVTNSLWRNHRFVIRW